MYKKRLISRTFDEKSGLKKLEELVPNEPTLIFTEMNPFKLFSLLKKNKSKTYAKANDTAQDDIVINAGPTNLLAGPAIGELQRAKIPAMIKEGKIHVREDTIVAKKGETISGTLANILKKLDIKSMLIGINVLGIWENGVIYSKDVLGVDEEEYLKNIKNAYFNALNLCVNVCYVNKESVKLLIQKAHQECKNLGINANIFDKDIVDDLIRKAGVQACSLKEVLKI
jgi:large subunit ribosomal protein L10